MAHTHSARIHVCTECIQRGQHMHMHAHVHVHAWCEPPERTGAGVGAVRALIVSLTLRGRT